MGYGGFFKKIVRIAVPIAASFIGAGPLAIAVSSAVATGATGGSFQEALISGATSFIGSSISESIAGAQAAAGDVALDSALAEAAEGIGGSIITDPALIGATPLAPLSTSLQLGVNAADAIDAVGGSLFQEFGDTGLGGFLEGGVETARTALDFLAAEGANTLGGLGSRAVGGLATLTLNQALLADTPEIDAELEDIGFAPGTIELLKNEARNTLSQQAFDRLTATTPNPFGTDPSGIEEFNKVIAAGIERENVGLGPRVTEQQFRQVFDNPNLGTNILGAEEDLRKASFSQDIGAAFPGDAFQPLDDEIINNIIQERQGPAQSQISAFQARGNLNPLGGQTANQFISGQVGQAGERLREIEQGVLSRNRAAVGDIRDRAAQQVSGFELGQDLFDVTPFAQERADVIGERQGTLERDITTDLGTEPLFDVSGALQAGGRAQGAVSGVPDQSFLDQIAARQVGSKRDKRGLGSRGSGAF